MDTLADNTMFQAAAAGLVLFVLMGSLMIEAEQEGPRSEEWPEPLKFDRHGASVNFQGERWSSSRYNHEHRGTYEFNV